MKRTVTALAALGLTMGAGQMALAQQAEPPPVPPPAAEQPPMPEVSGSELSTFVDIYVDLQETATRFEQEMAAVETAEQAQDIQERMRDESIDTIEGHGWTLDQYNTIAQAVNSDPDLVQEALRLIEERS